LNNNLALSLPTIYLFDRNRCASLLQEFLKECGQEKAETLFRLLFDHQEADKELVEFFFKESVPFSLSDYQMEQCLIKASKHKNAQEIFQYFMERFTYMQSQMDDRAFFRYNFVPTSDHSRFADELDEEIRYEVFKKSLLWLIFFKGDWKEEHAAKDLITYLKPDEELNNKLFSTYSQVYDLCREDASAVERLTETLSEFHNKSHKLFELVSFILEDSNKRFFSDNSIMSNIQMCLRDALTAAGVKTGTPGHPFAFDVRLKELIEEQLLKYDLGSLTHNLLKDVLSRVNHDIKRESITVKEEW
jgi:hypothetical protein